MFKSVLVVCTGNICRSPLGARLLQFNSPHLHIDSAGTRGIEGHPADKLALRIASQHGFSLENHKSKKITCQMLYHYDLILAMEQKHINHITYLAPEVRGKILLYGQWLVKKEIPDPIQQGFHAFELTYNLLLLSSQEWAKRLRR